MDPHVQQAGAPIVRPPHPPAAKPARVLPCGNPRPLNMPIP